MQLDTVSEVVQVNGGQGNSSFSIAMNGKAFRVLSDTLYTNKIGSIVRELSCNAYDAHVMNGNREQPFEIHLPDMFEPWFSVKDYGVGLTPEAVKSVFTVYFQSTKDQSNDTIGAFGLGAKTPFSYTDQFTVTSIVDGIRRDYSAYITESGVPNIICMQEVNTEEPNGVEIQMSVKSQDFQKFKQEVSEQLRFFKVFPIIKNGSVVFSEKKYIYESQNAKFFERNFGNQTNVYIVQGNVGYPLNIGEITSEGDNLEQINALHNLANIVGMELFFDIGQIGVTASREGVEYNARTIANIEKKAEVVIEEYKNWISTKISEYKTDAELMTACYENPFTIGKFVTRNHFKSEIVAGTNGNFFFELNIKLKNQNGYFVYANDYVCGRFVKSSQAFSSIPSFNMRDKVGIAVVDKNDVTMRLKRSKILCSEFGYKKLMVIKMSQNQVLGDIKKLIEDLLGSDIKVHNLHDVEVPKIARAKSVSQKCSYYSFVQGAEKLSDFNREDQPLLDIEDEVCFTIVKDRKISENDINRYKEVLRCCGEEEILPLIAIRVSDYEKYKICTKSNFVHVTDYLDSVSESVRNDPEVKKNYAKLVMMRTLASVIGNETVSEAFAETDSKINRYIWNVEEKKNTFNNMTAAECNKIDNVAMFAGVTNKHFSTYYNRAVKINNAFRKELDKYPFIKAYLNTWSMRSSDSGITKDHLVLYINAVNKEISK